MSIVVRLARRQTIVAEIESCPADILTRDDIPLSVEVSDSTCLLLDRLTAQIDCIGGDLTISHATYVALHCTCRNATSQEPNGSTLTIWLGVAYEDTYSVAGKLPKVLKPLTFEATTLKDDEEWRIERLGCIHCGLLRFGNSREHIGDDPLCRLRLILSIQGDGHCAQTALTQGDELSELTSIFFGVTLRTELGHRLRLLDAVDDDLRTFTSLSIELTHVLIEDSIILPCDLKALQVSNRSDGIGLAELVS